MLSKSSPTRTWSALSAGMIAVPTALVASLFGLFFLSLIDSSISLSNPPTSGSEIFSSLPGMIVLILPAQIAFFLIAALGALLSKEPFRTRLSLRLPATSPLLVPLLLVATPALGYLGSALSALIWDAPGENMQMISEIVRNAPTPHFFLLLILISVTPAICEEVLFRGYVQTRLVRVWHPAAGIAVSSVFFACVHIDPQHIFAVLPLAFWFGFIAYSSKSLVLPAACHFVNNALACVAMRFSEDPSAQEALEFTAFDAAAVSVSGAALLLSVALLVRSNTRP